MCLRTSTHAYVYTCVRHVPFQLSGEHKILQPFRRIELIVHIAISVLTGTHFHQVNYLRVKCLVQGHNIETLSQYWEGRDMIFLWKPEPSGIQNRTADSDTGRAPRCNHCAMSLSNNACVRLQISDSRHPCFSVIIYQPPLLLFPYVKYDRPVLLQWLTKLCIPWKHRPLPKRCVDVDTTLVVYHSSFTEI